MGASNRATQTVLAATFLLWVPGSLIGFPESTEAVRSLTLEQAYALAEQYRPDYNRQSGHGNGQVPEPMETRDRSLAPSFGGKTGSLAEGRAG